MFSFTWSELAQENGYRRWTRKLGGHEAAFYWDGELNGTCDVLSDTHVALPLTHRYLLADEEFVRRGWSRLKRIHPLLAASIVQTSDGLRFLLKEERFDTLLPEEFSTRTIHSTEEYKRILDNYQNGPRVLSRHLASYLVVLSIPSPEGDSRAHFRVFIGTGHATTDALASLNTTRTFFQTLVGEMQPQDISKRLELIPAVDHFFINPKISVAQRRWRMATAQIILQHRARRIQGGNTVPNRITAESLYTPSISRYHFETLDPEITKRTFATCRAQGVTFGHAFHVLCQLANASIIRHVRFDEKEWQYRQRQPSHFFGPLNIRPYLDRDWLRKGGVQQVFATGSNYQCTLPCLPVARASNRTLMSKEKFFHRCRLAKTEMDLQFKHPLILEFAAIYSTVHCAERSRFAKQWQDKMAGTAPTTTELKSEDAKYVSANQISTFGKLDDILPLSYPSAGPKVVEIVENNTIARTFPGQFYITAGTRDEKLILGSFWDANVYDDEMVSQWMRNLVGFIKEYLGVNGEVSQVRL